jgi:hypothetical protein
MHLNLRCFPRWIAAGALCLACTFVPRVQAQDAAESAHAVDMPDLPDAPSAVAAQSSSSQPASTPTTQGQPPSANNNSLEGKQTKRILWIIPNFRAVSVDAKLPPQTVKEKFWGATQDSFDYSSVIYVGILAGISQAEDSIPEFHQGAAGYGRYYWHTFVDNADENYWVEFFLPVAFRQDPRYYTLGRGGIIKRTGYSISRVFITRTDAGNNTFNVSEIVGAGAAAGISTLYYPSRYATWTKTGQRWLISVGLDGGTFLFKEFWPDINAKIFHQKPETSAP